MDRTDNTLRILVTVLSILFLLIAIKTSYPAESISIMTVNIAGKFVTYELILFSAIYVAGPMISEAMPGIWDKTRKLLRKQCCNHLPEPTIIKSQNGNSSSHLLLPSCTLPENDIRIQKSTLSNNMDEEDEDDSDTMVMEDIISDEIIEYTYKTFENILTTDQIEKILYGLRNFNNGGRFEVIVKEELPDYIYQFDILHFVWNVTKRVYDKKHSKYKFRDRAAEFAKSSFPLIVTSALESIGSTMSNVDNRTFSLPKIKPGKPLIPHDFNEVKQRKEAKNVA